MASRRDIPSFTRLPISGKAQAPFKVPGRATQLSAPVPPTEGFNDMPQEPTAASPDHSSSGVQASQKKLPKYKKPMLQKPQPSGMNATSVAPTSMQATAYLPAVLGERDSNVGFQANNAKLSSPSPSMGDLPKTGEINRVFAAGRVAPARKVAGQRRKNPADHSQAPPEKRTRTAASTKNTRREEESDEEYDDIRRGDPSDEEYQGSHPAAKPIPKQKRSSASKEKTMADTPSPDEIPEEVLAEMLEDLEGLEEVLAPVPGASKDNPYNGSDESIQTQVDELL